MYCRGGCRHHVGIALAMFRQGAFAGQSCSELTLEVPATMWKTGGMGESNDPSKVSKG